MITITNEPKKNSRKHTTTETTLKKSSQVLSRLGKAHPSLTLGEIEEIEHCGSLWTVTINSESLLFIEELSQLGFKCLYVRPVDEHLKAVFTIKDTITE